MALTKITAPVVRVETPDGVSHCYRVNSSRDDKSYKLHEVNGHDTKLGLHYVKEINQWYLVDTPTRSMAPVKVRHVWDIAGIVRTGAPFVPPDPKAKNKTKDDTPLVVTIRKTIPATDVYCDEDDKWCFNTGICLVYNHDAAQWVDSRCDAECTVERADLSTFAPPLPAGRSR